MGEGLSILRGGDRLQQVSVSLPPAVSSSPSNNPRNIGAHAHARMHGRHPDVPTPGGSPPTQPVCDRKWMGGRRGHVAAATLGPQSSVSVAESPRPSICSPPQRGICPPGESVEGTHRGGKEAHPPLTGRHTHTPQNTTLLIYLFIVRQLHQDNLLAQKMKINQHVLLKHVTNTSCQSHQLHPGTRRRETRCFSDRTLV